MLLILFIFFSFDFLLFLLIFWNFCLRLFQPQCPNPKNPKNQKRNTPRALAWPVPWFGFLDSFGFGTGAEESKNSKKTTKNQKGTPQGLWPGSYVDLDFFVFGFFGIVGFFDADKVMLTDSVL